MDLTDLALIPVGVLDDPGAVAVLLRSGQDVALITEEQIRARGAGKRDQHHGGESE